MLAVPDQRAKNNNKNKKSSDLDQAKPTAAKWTLD